MSLEITNYYLAALCAYSGYPLTQVRTEDRDTSFVFEIPSWSYDELVEAFDSPEGQPISSVKHFCESLQRLTALQRKARQNPEGVWTSRAWQTMGREKDVEVEDRVEH